MPVDVTENYIRIRVKDPGLFVDGSFKTITLSEGQGIKSVIGKLKSDPNGSTVVQNYMFDKDKWSVAEAEKWVADHKRESEMEEYKRQSGMEERSFDSRIGVSKEDHNITKLIGLAIPYGRLSDNPIPNMPKIKERILPGAFKRSVESGRDIMMVWNHELKFLFGRTSSGTLKLNEGNDGVTFENIPPESDWAKGLIPSIKRGDYKSMSFTFIDDVEPTWTNEEGQYVRNVRDATLYEISLVPSAVYESSSIYARNPELMAMLDRKFGEGGLDEFKKIEAKREADLTEFKKIEEKFNNIKKFWL